MEQAPGTILILICDASVAINFLRVNRADLIVALPFDVTVTDVVRAEITRRHQSQLIEEFIARGQIHVTALTDIQDLQAAGRLRSSGLGDGESVSIVAAHVLGARLAMDDRRARNVAHRLYPSLQILNTEEIMVTLIRMGALSIEEADGIADDWRTSHRFALAIRSFADLVP
jgi:predicted nucleic acid-binding protein